MEKMIKRCGRKEFWLMDVVDRNELIDSVNTVVQTPRKMKQHGDDLHLANPTFTSTFE